MDDNLKDKAKHRLIGIAFIVAIFILITPIFLDKNNVPEEIVADSFEINEAPQFPELIDTKIFETQDIADINLDAEVAILEKDTNNWYLQLASFRNPNNANNLQKVLQDKDLEANLDKTTNSAGVEIIRVNVGYFPSKKYTIEVQQKLYADLGMLGIVLNKKV